MQRMAKRLLLFFEVVGMSHATWEKSFEPITVPCPSYIFLEFITDAYWKCFVWSWAMRFDIGCVNSAPWGQGLESRGPRALLKSSSLVNDLTQVVSDLLNLRNTLKLVKFITLTALVTADRECP